MHKVVYTVLKCPKAFSVEDNTPDSEEEDTRINIYCHRYVYFCLYKKVARCFVLNIFQDRKKG